MANQPKQKKVKVEFSLDTIRTNPVTRQQLEGFIEEVVISLKKIEQEKEAVKDIRNEAKDSLGIPGRIFGKLVKENMQEGSIEAEIHELEQVQDIANAIEGKQPQSA